MSKFAILLGGDVTVTQRLREQVPGARVIAADSGMRHAEALQLQPELWVGDFDSADHAMQQRHTYVPRVTFPKAKDATDGALAVQEAVSRGATELILVGAFGGRFDLALSHATLLISLAARDIAGLATSGNEEAWPLIHDLNLADVPRGTILSVIGFSALKGLTMTGVRWPLEQCDVEMGSTLTFSNEVTGAVSLRLQAGSAVVLLGFGAGV
jgi:thiamine pyrophosphokinase